MERLEAYVPDLALGWAVDGSTPWSTRHASMMFADLSGFTKLSERVARVKGAGAEVVPLDWLMKKPCGLEAVWPQSALSLQ